MTDEERKTWNQIKHIANRRVPNHADRSDVMQIAWVYYQTRKTTPVYAVSEAIRTHFGTRSVVTGNEQPLPNPDWVASHYQNDSQISTQEAIEMAEEENERHAAEWRRMSAHERRNRILESYRATQTLIPGHE